MIKGRWEYTVISREKRMTAGEMNILGNQAWELVAVVADGSRLSYFFKKEIMPRA